MITQRPDPILVKSDRHAHRFHARLVDGGLRIFGDFAGSEKLHRFYLTQLLRPAYLAPDIGPA
jgi:hypothetical protein